jgi:hypothetical protein
MAPLPCPGMGGFCRQNSLENPPLRQDATACDWNPSFFALVGMRDPKYAIKPRANTNVDSDALNLNLIIYALLR